jgi:hypothetical protein
MGYHPDTPFADYVDGKGRGVFSAPEASRLDELAERAFSFCDPYEFGLQEFHDLAPALEHPQRNP